GDPFMQFAGRMHDKTARRHGHGLVGRAHRPAALEAEINLGRVRVTVIGARLAGLPTGDRYITLGDASADARDMLFRIELLFALQVKTVHRSTVRANPEFSRTAWGALHSAFRIGSPRPNSPGGCTFEQVSAFWQGLPRRFGRSHFF